MTQATYDDVNLILRLYEMRREDKLRASRAWYMKNCKPKNIAELQELCPPGSDNNAQWRQMVTYWDMAASFVNAGVLHRDLFFQNNREMLMTWLRVKPVIADLRVNFKDPNFLKNLEQAATAFIEFLGPETFQAFAARVGG